MTGKKCLRMFSIHRSFTQIKYFWSKIGWIPDAEPTDTDSNLGINSLGVLTSHTQNFLNDLWQDMKHIHKQDSVTNRLQQCILGLSLFKKFPLKTMAYLPSMFRIHTSSSSKNISGPSRFSMSLKPLQGTYKGDIQKKASEYEVAVTHTQILLTAILHCLTLTESDREC